jgi:hypothetical protein
MSGDPDAFIELPLCPTELNGANDLGLGRQLRRHLILGPAKDEGSDSIA